MFAKRCSTTTAYSRVRGGAARRARDDRGAVFLPMTGLVVVLFGLSALLADQLGAAGRDADALAAASAASGAAALSGSLTGLDPAEAKARASRLDPGPACQAARDSAAPDGRLTTCSIVGTDLVVVVVTTEAPTSTASATVSLTGGATS